MPTLPLTPPLEEGKGWGGRHCRHEAGTKQAGIN